MHAPKNAYQRISALIKARAYLIIDNSWNAFDY